MIFKLNKDGFSVAVKGDGTETGDVIIPATYETATHLLLPVTRIAKLAFYGNPNITTITIPASVETVGFGALSNCKNLTEVTYEGNQNDEFCYLSSAQNRKASIAIPEGTQKIGDLSFLYNESATSVVIPDSVESIGAGSFMYCTAISEFIVSINSPYYKTVNGVLYTKDMETLVAFPPARNTNSFTVPKTVRKIESYCFLGNQHLETIDIGDSKAVFVNECAFFGCKKLSSVIFSTYTTVLQDRLFQECGELSTVVAPAALELKNFLFYRCPKMETLQTSFPLEEIKVSELAYVENVTREEVPLPDIITFEKSEDQTHYIVSSYQDPEAVGGLINIPAEYEGLPVRHIADFAFKGCDELTQMILPSSIETIGMSAFEGCSRLHTINLPTSITTIEPYAFHNCVALQDVALPNLTKIENNVFENCVSFFSLDIPGTVEVIDEAAFRRCTGVNVITINEGTREIRRDAFAFVGESASRFLDVSFPNSLRIIGPYAFNTTSKIEGLTLKEGLREVGAGAFSSCGVIDTLTIPSTLTKLDPQAFIYTDFLTINVSGSNYTYKERCNNIYSKDGETIVLHGGTMDDNELNGVLHIGDYAYHSSASSRATVNLPSNLKTIGTGSFGECPWLSSITLPASVESIGFNAFDGCLNLASVTVESGVKDIDQNVFRGCISLSTIQLPSTIDSFEANAFSSCKLTNVIFADTNPHYKSIDGNVYTEDGSTLLMYCGNKQDTSFTVPSSVTIIGPGAFRGSRFLQTVDLNNVEVLEDYCFAESEKLTTIAIPEGVEVIPAGAFARCKKLATVELPTSLLTIKALAFTNSSLPSITIPSGVNDIEPGSFDGCSSLRAINVTEGNLMYTTDNDCLYSKDNTIFYQYAYGKTGTSFSLLAGTEVIADGAFASTKLQAIQLPSTVTEIRPNAFKNSDVTSVLLQAGLTEIPLSCFEGCTELQTVFVPTTVDTIGSNAFAGCGKLQSVVIPEICTYVGNYAFFNCGAKVYTALLEQPDTWDFKWNPTGCEVSWNT